MPILTINGKIVSIDSGKTLLEAAHLAGITIPTLCHSKNLPHFTSCMVCVVEDKNTRRLLPSCSALATDGMVIETDSPEARHARNSSLNLLMSEHAGDCEAPCTTTCPGHLKIPLMIRQIANGQTNAALETLYDTIALPAVVGRICHTPCEKACRRGQIDASLSICLLERFAADEASIPPLKPGTPTGKRVAIIGAGPAGLAAAFYLARAGHESTLFDDHDQPGGQLRYGVPDSLLPRAVLDREIQRIHQLGVSFRMNTRIGAGITLQELRAEYDALILAAGKTPSEHLKNWDLKATNRGITVDAHTLRTSDEKIFAGGEMVQEGHLAVRAMAHGRTMAISIDQFLKGHAVSGPVRRFESRLGRIKEEESRELLKEADPHSRLIPRAGSSAGFSPEEAIRESRRCMHCDCRKAEACRLRDYMELQKTGPLHIPVEARKPVTRNISHPKVIFEPGKCVKCGLCVRITAQAGEKTGLAFLGRGFDTVVGVPFGESLEAGLGESAGQCVKECPTGALAWKES